jgi:hypothetical protein
MQDHRFVRPEIRRDDGAAFACAMAQRTISSGDLARNSALALEIWSGVIFS